MVRCSLTAAGVFTLRASLPPAPRQPCWGRRRQRVGSRLLENLVGVISVVTPTWRPTRGPSHPGLSGRMYLPGKILFRMSFGMGMARFPMRAAAYCGNFSFLRESIGMPRPRLYLAGGLTARRRRVITGPVNSAAVEVRGGGAAARPFLSPACLVYASLADPRRPGHHYRRPLPPTALGANLPPTDS